MSDEARERIIRRCINALRNEYEDWPGNCQRMMTRDETQRALAACEAQWPDYAFRSRHVLNQRPGTYRLRVVK